MRPAGISAAPRRVSACATASEDETDDRGLPPSRFGGTLLRKHFEGLARGRTTVAISHAGCVIAQATQSLFAHSSHGGLRHFAKWVAPAGASGLFVFVATTGSRLRRFGYRMRKGSPNIITLFGLICWGPKAQRFGMPRTRLTPPRSTWAEFRWTDSVRCFRLARDLKSACL